MKEIATLMKSATTAWFAGTDHGKFVPDISYRENPFPKIRSRENSFPPL